MILIYLVLCTIIFGYFAGLETGLLSANRMLLQEKKRKGILYARTAEYLLSKPARLLGTTLVGCNAASVTAAVLFTKFFEKIGLAHLTWLGILLMSIILLMFGDLIPKSFFRRYADTVAVRLSPMLLLINILFLPITFILTLLINGLLFVTGQYASRREEVKSKRDLRFLINLKEMSGGLTHAEQKMIEDILDFRDQSAREVMTPFHRIPVVNVNQSIREVALLSYQTKNRFIPVSEYRTDNVIGYIDTEELLWKKAPSIRKIMKHAVYFPETRRIPDLLLDINRNDQKVVFLSDEYGGVAGMITPGQIVGNLVHYVPETGSREEAIKVLEPGHYLVQGSADLEDLGHEIGLTVKSGYNRSLGGFLCEKLGVIPEEGRVYEEGGFSFKVTRCDDRHVQEIEIVRNKKPH